MSVENKAKVVSLVHRVGAVLLTVLLNMNASAAGVRVRTV
ncbi:hypothetical protein TPB0596_14480 [Tsukamurella pulmonis]|uniref:Uncharacterized protein n=1 Tax=Tsukamurella pulmonis TaxID=47312 RepID=A0A1H1GNT4_9ACTN|nr:hypothetical protein TPB0596_14480 [Tsukamurella pulmonis]SDR14809.1 hypothetical protein SAMN04489765_3458 [Tsukamurella pulmonis]SUP16951.1 Uncharacterised protein [Tsukamurella pulmonis]